jgi:hypothetical protein
MKMKRHRILVCIAGALSSAGIAASAVSGAPITKQNGTTPVFNKFTSICAVPGYVNYGNCGGDPTTYTNVTGRINAVQAKAGVWNLGFSFTNLQPGASYRLWGNRSPATPSPGTIGDFFPIATAVAALDGTAKFSYQTTDPSNLGFDLNILADAFEIRGTTVVTSYWSLQSLSVLNPDGTLYVPGS